MVRGKDELAELGKYFNLMSDKVEQNIEDLKEETQRKQRLVDNLAHELRTPLTAISGYAEYMQMAKLDEDEQYHALNYIRRETKQIEKLSQVLLLLADIRETEIPMESIPIKKLIKSIKHRFAKNLSEKNIHFIYHEYAESIYGNYELLEILLSNLIENAHRASKQNGKVEIISCIEDNNVVLTIADDGIGMEQEDLLHIMEPFYRVDKARSRKHGGIGLGTALCEQIVNRHQATIHYESVINVGTTVKLEFALHKDPYHNLEGIDIN
jgi:signal transduction histidine kinase